MFLTRAGLRLRPFAFGTAGPTSYIRNNHTHFDSLKFVTQLQENGFSKEQSEAAVNVFSKAINDGIDLYASNLITKEVLSRQSYQQKVDFAKLKGELQLIDRSEFNNIRTQHEKLRNDLEKVKQRLKEEVNKSLSSVRLDLNLERGRIREESSIHDLKIKETDTRIDQEIANMKVQIDSTKTQVLQWLIGVCTGTFALVLAYVRLLS
ncbi:BA75_01918T0 [Komagataella pastoris]|uniref:BA75_01918T0 n=1 Tax=Komagataella pastoris TaxID=4922 RepID=A0A1B2JEJ5_PICPA|nr:BA75_01918T0 [Komagataella pastoris]